MLNLQQAIVRTELKLGIRSGLDWQTISAGFLLEHGFKNAKLCTCSLDALHAHVYKSLNFNVRRGDCYRNSQQCFIIRKIIPSNGATCKSQYARCHTYVTACTYLMWMACLQTNSLPKPLVLVHLV